MSTSRPFALPTVGGHEINLRGTYEVLVEICGGARMVLRFTITDADFREGTEMLVVGKPRRLGDAP